MVTRSQTPVAPMEGRGAYNANSALQASGAAFALPLLVEAADVIPIDEGRGPIAVADYGSSEGRNSVVIFKTALPHLRARSPRPILVAHTDQPTNDFGTLFSLAVHEDEGYAGIDNVFTSAVGRSFYEPVLPPDFVHLGWSSYAAQWLSRVPSPVTGHFHPSCGQPHERQAFAEQGRIDWETFLTLRCRELCPGGRLVIVMPAPNEHGVLGVTPLFDAANNVLAGMVRDGTLLSAEYEAMVLSQHLRTLDELLAPFAMNSLKGRLRVVAASVTPIGDVAHREYQASGDAVALAARRAGFFRATFGPTLASALRRGNGFDDRRSAFLDRLKSGMKQAFVSITQPIDYRVGLLSVEKH